MDRAQLQYYARTYGGWALLILQVVGIFLLGSQWGKQFVFLTPVNLTIVAVLFYLASEPTKNEFFYFLPALMGWLIELAGTNTGFPFGEYTYSGILGPGLFGTPFMIGILWWVLIRSAYDICGQFISSDFFKSIITGLAMVGLDILIEPVAIGLNFWQWASAEVPLENYVAWFMCSAVFARVTAAGDTKNPLSYWIWGTMLLFFGALNFVY